MDIPSDMMASSPNDSSDTSQNEIQMDIQRAALEEWERSWAPETREPNSQMNDDTNIPLIYFSREEEEKMSQDLFPWPWETKTSWRAPIGATSMHEKFQRTVTGLKKQLEQIQKYRMKRDNITDWASNLRFLTGPAPIVRDDDTMNPRPTEQMCACTCFSWEKSFERGKGILPACCSCASAASHFLSDSREFRLIQETPNCHHYIAVSYRWWVNNDDTAVVEGAQDSDAQKAAGYLSTVIDRAVKFSLHHGYQLVWIDQKCIIQNDMADKTIGVQAMDLVYENASLCLAVLQCKITSQEQISALKEAMDVSLHPVSNEKEWRKWIEYLDHKELIAMAEVVKMITEDEYFSRAWIAQENTAANATILLLKYDSPLIRPDSMGSLDGEIQLPLCEFRVACAKLAGAFQGTIEKKVWYYEREAARYDEDDWFGDRRNFFRHNGYFPRPPSIEQFKASIEPDQQWKIYFDSFLRKCRGSHVARRHQGRYHCSAAEAVEFLSTKHNYEIADRLAIIANLCNYEVRLDGQKLKELGYDLAVSLFCLALLNGDLSLARLPDGIEYKDLGVEQFSWDHITLQISHGQDVLHRTVDIETGPSSFSWAPRLREGFMESPRIYKDNKRYALEFLGPKPRLHMYGWLWHKYETFDFSDFAKIFKKRLSNNPEETKHSFSLKEKWEMTTTNQLDCFWDLIQELRNRQLSSVSEALWISLLMFNQGVEHISSTAERYTLPNSLDPRDDDKLRLAIHDISLENFKDFLPLGRESTEDIVIPYYWMIQNIIEGNAINLWKLDDTHLSDSDNMTQSTSRPQHAFFNDYHSKSLFTPITRSVAPRSLPMTPMDEQRLLSWPVNVTDCSDDGLGVCIKVDRVGFDKGHPFNPVVGFWNVNRIPTRPYILQ
ncbi:uncharacterized protein EAE97_010126 [Botrytis byssoidea]|uniref:Heterokaryon incompatibility domain-containing protein n=1 Tax=Botrytis byssoidea TaxID=139641 RepID=A0A9P5I3X3_9HELO|nr:uncharacterized protein EAE97_010126 [Botrytis byssoidea]KAF7926617.1 hypothetical protein EAE97_010126 [Botrytis byssoidea]